MTRLNPDDPKWTAYILGELNVTDREAVEKELESSEEARTLVDELRFAADLTMSELRNQAPLTFLTFEQRRTIRAAAGVERPRRWFGTRPMVWAASVAAVSITLLVAAVSSIVLHQRHATPVAAKVESTIAENRSPQVDSERQSERPLQAELKKAKSSTPPAKDDALAPAQPVTATAPAPMAPPPPPATALAQDVLKQAVVPAPSLDEFRTGAGFEPGLTDQKGQALVPVDKSPIVANALVGRAVVAPAPSGRIFGTVSDAAAARIPGVAVNATDVQTGAVASAVTNEAGAYILEGLQTGTYQVKAELPGFQTFVSTGVQVSAGSPVQRDLTMQVAAATESVEVTVAADTVVVSKALGGRGAAGKDTLLQGLVVVPPASSFAPALSSANAASENAFLKADPNPVSRFSADMNTGAYANVRRYLNDQNQLPPRDAVRIEAMVNSFSYDYPPPAGNNPFSALIEAAAAPWNPQHRLVRIGIKAKNVDARRRPSGNIVASDVKLEVEFNPAVVGEYRLIDEGRPGQQIRASSSDAKDAGSVEAGQTFTALYEIVPKVLKSGSTQTLTVKMSYKDSNGGDARQLVLPLVDRGQTFERAGTDFRFAAAVASFGMVLSDSPYKGTASFDSTLAIAEHSMGSDHNGQRHEFVQLIERARQLGAKRQ
jgi:hypothetical protein